MQVKHLAVALVAALPLIASAQSSVVVYGIADASIAREDTDVANGSKTVVGSGNQSTSRIGFKGTEDLGNGLKAIFNIEAGYQIDTGATSAALFDRKAVVGLQGSFGQVTVGREYGPIAAVAQASDALGQGFYGTNLSAFSGTRLTRRLSNSVNYASPSMGGFKFLAAYGADEKTVAAAAVPKVLGAALQFANGPVYLGVGYQTTERFALNDERKELAIGGGLKFGAFDFKGNYLSANLAGPNNTFKQYNIGATYTMGASKLLANYQQNKMDGGAKGNGYSIAYAYTLTKRTNLYSAYSTLRNNNTGRFGISSAGSAVAAGAAGADPSAFTIGVRHLF